MRFDKTVFSLRSFLTLVVLGLLVGFSGCGGSSGSSGDVTDTTDPVVLEAPSGHAVSDNYEVYDVVPVAGQHTAISENYSVRGTISPVPAGASSGSTFKINSGAVAVAQ